MEKFKEHAKKNKKSYTALGLVLLFVLVGIIVQEANARLGAFGQIEVGGVIGGAAIVIDDRIVENTESGISTILTNARPGKRKITVQKEGYWSWQKVLEIEEGETVKITPYLLRRQPILSDLPNVSGAEVQKEAISLFDNTKDRTGGVSILTSDDGNVAVWQEENRVVARYDGDRSNLPHYFCNDTKCSEEITITPLKGVSIETIDFLQGRSDVILLTFDEGVFALELDQRSNQNLQPLIELPGTDFRERDNSSVFLEYDNKIGILTF